MTTHSASTFGQLEQGTLTYYTSLTKENTYLGLKRLCIPVEFVIIPPSLNVDIIDIAGPHVISPGFGLGGSGP